MAKRSNLDLLHAVEGEVGRSNSALELLQRSSALIERAKIAREEASGYYWALHLKFAIEQLGATINRCAASSPSRARAEGSRPAVSQSWPSAERWPSG